MADLNPKEPHKMNEYVELGSKVLDKADGIPKGLWKACAGVLLLHGGEGGFGISAQGSSGVALAHKDGEWSPPIAVSLASIGVGATFGYVQKDIVILLNHFAMDNLLKGDGQLKIGLDAGFAVGKVGRAAGADLAVSNELGMGSSFVFTYQKGVMFNVEVVFSCQTKAIGNVNEEFYGTNDPETILTKHAVKVPEDSAVPALLEKLDQKTEKAHKKADEKADD